ncbi:hypothetical protein CON65_20410 [Bacillus pseudomycoides]|uniref:DUF559 domain-containing protein n=1 Tax=Bacillus pseudomycoides TaxID=64104 RepID=A0AA91ZRP6_9BACI|nr:MULTISPECIES: hypothetical protein [Bacillus]PEB50410.1 hypothetical protein COO03_22355 [Bacillus sp. AFS098217]PED80860.1 hypothetical protein CON65_20410 [Bacillus pseudomycoides]PEU11306.1 hypothetical protein CN525_22480 [Bacillus sp. AFS014408]PFW57975.1 hypothetical protein COL20_25755 [Bacillus sp. AFS075034]
MLELPQKIKVEIHPMNVNHFIDLGYKPILNDYFLVDAQDLMNTSTSSVKVKCDFCDDIYNMKYCDYWQHVLQAKHPELQKAACKKCKQKKSMLSHILNYGVASPMERKEVRQKIANKLYMNQSVPSSTQQRYFCMLLKGEHNFPVDGWNLDIAFPELNIYLEYDGSGHEISLKDNKSKIKFQKKENRRFNNLKQAGWKMVRILSKKDFLPENHVILRFFEEIKEILTHEKIYWVNLDIDSSKLLTDLVDLDIELGSLRKITSIQLVQLSKIIKSGENLC